MNYAIISKRELQNLTTNRASSATFAVFTYIKMNIDTNTGLLKAKIGDEYVNYRTIANRLGYHHTNVRKSIKWLNKHGLIDTHLDKILRGRVRGIDEDKYDKK